MKSNNSSHKNVTSSLPIFDLGADFFDPVEPGDFREQKLRFRNTEVSKIIGLESVSDEEWIEHFGKFKPLPENIQQPLALRYHGHQFQSYNPQLGDGRGFLFAQFQTSDGLFELGTKGSGQTPYSRRGDGRLTLKGAVREALCTTYLQYQGVNTSKTFSVVETGESLIRYDEPSPTRSAVLFRFSHGHTRIGTFQRLLFNQDAEGIKKLVKYSLVNYYPEIEITGTYEIDAKLFLDQVLLRLSDLVASYMIAGFIHGVLNTDNINISGESFDYGPYRFMPMYDPNFTAAYFDHEGLYAYLRQPEIFLWNIKQLAMCLNFVNPIASDEKIEESFSLYFQFHLVRRFFKKINIRPKSAPNQWTDYMNSFSQKNKYHNPWVLSLKHFEKYWSLENITEFQNHIAFKKSFKLTQLFFKTIKNEKEIDFETVMFLLKLDFKKLPKHWHPFVDELTHEFETLGVEPGIGDKLAAPEKLLIDEIEDIWNEISEHDNWNSFNQKISRLNFYSIVS